MLVMIDTNCIDSLNPTTIRSRPRRLPHKLYKTTLPHVVNASQNIVKSVFKYIPNISIQGKVT
jgi:hypothetical protein